jgi:hypothetical protein
MPDLSARKGEYPHVGAYWPFSKVVNIEQTATVNGRQGQE